MRSRFKGLDLRETVPEELWMEVHDIVQETGIKTIPKKKKYKKQNDCLRRPYKYLRKEEKKKQRRKGKINPSECRVPKNSKERLKKKKKAFLSGQCKEIEENNRMGKTRDLFKKIRDTKATYHAKMGSIKERNAMDLTEAEDIKKRWQEYTETVQKRSS